MRLIHSNQIARELKDSFTNAHDIVLITAYLTSGVFTVLDRRVLSDKKITLYFRGNKQDFVNGTVCVNTIRALHASGVRCLLVRNLHSKVYIFDEKTMYVGSANLTNNGLSSTGNIEVLYKTQYEQSFRIQLKESLQYAVELTDEILFEIEEDINNLEVGDNIESYCESIDWRFWSQKEFIDDLTYLTLPRCNISEPLDFWNPEDLEHDQILFGLNTDGTFDCSLFIQSSLHQFLVKEVMFKSEERQFIRFGELKHTLIRELDLDTLQAEKITKNIFSYYKNQECKPLYYERYIYTESLRLQL
ncbi:hypothetical protein OURE66S_02690 [Oligella ureolytica]